MVFGAGTGDPSLDNFPFGITEKKRFVCEDCGSEDVAVDAVVRWNRRQQKWDIKHVHDDQDVSCSGCGDGARAKFKEKK